MEYFIFQAADCMHESTSCFIEILKDDQMCYSRLGRAVVVSDKVDDTTFVCNHDLEAYMPIRLAQQLSVDNEVTIALYFTGRAHRRGDTKRVQRDATLKNTTSE